MQIYYFLVKFPVYGRLLEDFDSETTPYLDVFPLGQPFKSLYAIHALRQYVGGSSQQVSHCKYPISSCSLISSKGSANESVMIRATKLIVAAISDKDVLGPCASDDLRDCLALHFIDCLVQFLKGSYYRFLCLA